MAGYKSYGLKLFDYLSKFQNENTHSEIAKNNKKVGGRTFFLRQYFSMRFFLNLIYFLISFQRARSQLPTPKLKLKLNCSNRFVPFFCQNATSVLVWAFTSHILLMVNLCKYSRMLRCVTACLMQSAFKTVQTPARTTTLWGGMYPSGKRQW